MPVHPHKDLALAILAQGRPSNKGKINMPVHPHKDLALTILVEVRVSAFRELPTGSLSAFRELLDPFRLSGIPVQSTI